MNISTADNDLLPKLVAAKVLHESRLDTPLSRVLVVTDSENPYPTISPDAVVVPMFTIAVIGGALSAYEPELGDDHDGVELYDGQENVAAGVVAQLNHLCRVEKKVAAIALVTRIPSLTTQGISLQDILSQMVRVENQIQLRHRKLLVASFLSTKLPDNTGEFVFMLDVVHFRKWQKEHSLRLVDDDDGEDGTEVVPPNAYEELAGVTAATPTSPMPFKHPHDRRI